LEYEAASPYLVIASPTFSRKDLALAARIACGCDLFYNRGRAVPWFGIILEGLEMAPSKVFESFATWLESRSSEELTRAQQDFIGLLFEEKGLSLMGTVAADIIGYFGYAAELMAAGPRAPDRREPPSRRVSFYHDPAELLAQMEDGTISLEELVFNLPEKRCEAVLSLTDGKIDIRVLPGAEAGEPRLPRSCDH
jgi:hypothetical protein